MTYFFDECLPPKVAEALRVLGQDVVHIRNAAGFALGEKDTVWMPKIAERGWILVTDDNRIRRKPEERELLEELTIRAVFVAGGVANLPLFEQARYFINHWQVIVKHTARCNGGDHFKVAMNGNVTPFARCRAPGAG